MGDFNCVPHSLLYRFLCGQNVRTPEATEGAALHGKNTGTSTCLSSGKSTGTSTCLSSGQSTGTSACLSSGQST
eukprot:2020563-Pleurochrysis_carterae.AAC.1